MRYASVLLGETAIPPPPPGMDPIVVRFASSTWLSPVSKITLHPSAEKAANLNSSGNVSLVKELDDVRYTKASPEYTPSETMAIEPRSSLRYANEIPQISPPNNPRSVLCDTELVARSTS